MKHAESRYLIFSVLVLLLPCTKAVCTGSIEASDLIIGFQQQQGTPETTSIAHQLTSSQSSSGQTCSDIIDGMFMSGPNSNCTVDCLVPLTAYKYTNGSDYVDIVMARPQDVSLYPEYSVIGGSVLYCAALQNNCGASVPLYGFVSFDYADHYVGSSSQIDDASYGYDNSGIPLCYIWNVPQDESSKSTFSGKYSSRTNSSCDVPTFLGLLSTTSSTDHTVNCMSINCVANTTTATHANSTISHLLGSTTMASSIVPLNSSSNQNSNSTLTTMVSPSNVTTRLSSNSSLATGTPATGVGSNQTVIGSTVTGLTASGNNTNSNSTQSPVQDDPGSGNSTNVARDVTNKKDENHTWIWVLLGVGVGVAILATIILTCFITSNFASSTSKASVGPYDRNGLYTGESRAEPPPVPASSMPVQSY